MNSKKYSDYARRKFDPDVAEKNMLKGMSKSDLAKIADIVLASPDRLAKMQRERKK